MRRCAAFTGATLGAAGLSRAFADPEGIELKVGPAPAKPDARLRLPYGPYHEIEARRVGGTWWTSVEELPAYRLLLRAILAHTLAQQGRLLLHAAAIGERGRAWLFPGPNGAGKSTLARQARGTPLADDAVVVFLEDGQPFAEGTPFVSDDGPSPHTGIVPIAGVLTLKKGMRTRLHPIGRRSLVRTMLEQLFLPPGQSEPTVSQLRTLLQTATSVVTGELEFTRSTRFCAADLGIPPVPCAVGA